jgi:hypothetical protein
MLAVPAATPVTIPEASTEAVAVLEEDHEPPVVAHARVIVPPAHADPVPVMAAGIAYTLTIAVTVVPANEYVMVDVPADIPITTPLAEPIVATAGVLLLHEPPVALLANVVVAPIQVVSVPVIGEENAAFTVTT